jgi:hypothetical protein
MLIARPGESCSFVILRLAGDAKPWERALAAFAPVPPQSCL